MITNSLPPIFPIAYMQFALMVIKTVGSFSVQSEASPVPKTREDGFQHPRPLAFVLFQRQSLKLQSWFQVFPTAGIRYISIISARMLLFVFHIVFFYRSGISKRGWRQSGHRFFMRTTQSYGENNGKATGFAPSRCFRSTISFKLRSNLRSGTICSTYLLTKVPLFFPREIYHIVSLFFMSP